MPRTQYTSEDCTILLFIAKHHGNTAFGRLAAMLADDKADAHAMRERELGKASDYADFLAMSYGQDPGYPDHPDS